MKKIAISAILAALSVSAFAATPAAPAEKAPYQVLDASAPAKSAAEWKLAGRDVNKGAEPAGVKTTSAGHLKKVFSEKDTSPARKS